MSVYTTELRYIVEEWTTAEPEAGIDEMITGAIPAIFNFTFPIWDETYRQTLCHKILDYYWLREIGFETAALWRMYLKRKLQNIMPYYVELHKSVEAEYNFLEPYNVTESISRESEGYGNNSSTGSTTNDGATNTDSSGTNNTTVDETTASNGSDDFTSTGHDNNYTLNSDLPQVKQESAVVYDYGTTSSQAEGSHNQTDSRTTDSSVIKTASNNTTDKSTNDVTSHNESDSNSSMIYTNENTENITNHKHGNPGGKSYSELVQEFRAAILNIDMMIINDLEPLFMGLWQ